MQRFKKFLGILICLSIFVGSLTVLTVCAAVKYPVSAVVANAKGAQIWSLPGTVGHETEENKGMSTHLCTLENGTELIVLGDEKDGDGDIWYKVNYGENFAGTGYAYSGRVKLNMDYEYDEDFEKNLLNFPESYRESLRVLHMQYPNWQFKAHNVGISFKETVEAQYGVNSITASRKWVEFTYGGNEWRDMRGYDAANDSWIILENRWTYASRAGMEYFIDPRNSLDENNIFVFMQQSYDSNTHTIDNLRSVIEGTFLANGYDTNGDGIPETDAYLNDIMAAAGESSVNPYVLAATIIVEQGTNGTSGLISGTYPGYEGYYNFFNVGANGSDVVVSGLEYAKREGVNWNSRTASIVGGAKFYADGYISIGQDTYYYKDFNVINKDWNHQYATALYDAWTNANRLKKGCITNKNAAITFIIPVYTDMPDTPCPTPTVESIPTPPPPIIKKGDINKDEQINAIDLASVKMDILGVKKLSGDEAIAGDVNGDGVINAIDLAAIKMHILGVKTIS